MRRYLTLVAVVLGAAAVTAQQSVSPTPAGEGRAEGSMIDRIGVYVEKYYTRAQSILALETVTLQPLTRDFGFDGFARRLVYELRLEWDPAAGAGDGPARIRRELVTVNGRPPRPGQEPQCLDPRGISPEPLAFLLPDRRGKFIFHPGPSARMNGRPAAVFEYRSVRPEPPRVEWKDDCGSIDLPGRSRGRVWADAETAAILRLDEQLTGMVEVPVPRELQRRGGARYWTVERADTSIRYRPVTFYEPEETIMLPEQVESVVVILNSGSPRMRITQSYANYRRFVTAGRLIR